jgi:hypothetical protein
MSPHARLDNRGREEHVPVHTTLMYLGVEIPFFRKFHRVCRMTRGKSKGQVGEGGMQGFASFRKGGVPTWQACVLQHEEGRMSSRKELEAD